MREPERVPHFMRRHQRLTQCHKRFFRHMLRLRREHSVLARGRLWHLASDESSYIFLRTSDEEKIVVSFNNSKESCSTTIPLKDTPAEKTLSLTRLFGEAHGKTADGALQLTMPPQSLSIFVLD